jgi:hypothetical protein
MATQTVRVSFGCVKDGAGTDPDSESAVVTKPDGTSHSTPTPAKNAVVGVDGAYQVPVVINDTDPKGTYTCWLNVTYGANTIPIPQIFKVE